MNKDEIQRMKNGESLESIALSQLEQRKATATGDELAEINKQIKEIKEVQAQVTRKMNSYRNWLGKNAYTFSVMFDHRRAEERDLFFDSLTLEACQKITGKEYPEELRTALKKKITGKTPEEIQKQRDEKAAEILGFFQIADIVEIYNKTAPIEQRDKLVPFKKVRLMNDKIPNTLTSKNGQLQQLGQNEDGAPQWLSIQDDIITALIGSPADGQLRLAWASYQSKKEVPVFFSISYSDLTPATKKKLDAFDITIINHIGSMFYYQQLKSPGSKLKITPRELWANIIGAKDSGKVSIRPEKLEMFKKRIERLSRIRIEMNITEELQRGMYTLDDERLVSGYVVDNMIHSTLVSFRTEKNRIVEGYYILEMPILFSYCLAKNHLITVPIELTKIEGNINEDVIKFRDYLIKEVVRAKTGNRSRTFLLSTIYEKTGTKPPAERLDKTKYKPSSYTVKLSQEFGADKKIIERILRTWKNKGYIFDYKSEGQALKMKFTVSFMPEISEKNISAQPVNKS